MDWISIKKKVPKEGQWVITFHDETGISIMYYRNLIGTDDEIFGEHYFSGSRGFLTDDVTHWMPLPEPPEKEDYFK